MTTALVLLGLLLASPWRGWARLASAQEAAKLPYAISANAEPAVLKSGSRIILSIALKNTSSQTIRIMYVSGAGHGYNFEVRDNRGELVGLLPSKWRDTSGHMHLRVMAGSLRDTEVKPGQTFYDAFPLSERFDLRKPGRYTIQGSRYDFETRTWVKFNTITLTVTP